MLKVKQINSLCKDDIQSIEILIKCYLSPKNWYILHNTFADTQKKRPINNVTINIGTLSEEIFAEFCFAILALSLSYI